MADLKRREFLTSALGAVTGSILPHSANAAPARETRPNIVLIMADDMGFSDLGCYGSEINTPNLDRLAKRGLRFSQFYNSPRCCPSRAALLTGLYSHQAGFGLMADDFGKYQAPAYRGDLSDRCVTIAEVLRQGGYRTAMSGKWHLTPPLLESKHNWPMQRGFERFFGTIAGAGSYFDPATLVRNNERVRAHENFFYTDAIAENAVSYIDEYARQNAPFFLYTAFTAPHWPLQAFSEDIAKYRGRYASGWDALRADRHERMVQMGIVDRKWGITRRDPRVPPWEAADYKDWEQRRMEVYAAQVERMDRGVGQIFAKLEQLGIADNTLVLFLADNGGNAEEMRDAGPLANVPLFIPHETFDGRLVRTGNDPAIAPGTDDTYQSYGIPWGNVSNTPFRQYKHFAHEGGISTPLIAHWPKVIGQSKSVTHQVGHEIDIMATCLEAAGVAYPKMRAGHSVIPLEGKSLMPIFQGKQREGHGEICWEHEGNCALRQGKWKLVSSYPNSWELYDMEADRTEMHNLVDQQPARLKEMAGLYAKWAKRVGVEPWPLPGLTLSAPGVPPYLRQ